MPKVRSLDTKKVCHALDKHTKDSDKHNAIMRKVFNRVIFFMSRGVRDISYKDIAEWDKIAVGRVKYYFDKLVAYGAINLYDKTNKPPEDMPPCYGDDDD